MNKNLRYASVALGAALICLSVWLYFNFTFMPKTDIVTDNNLHQEYDDKRSDGNLVMLTGKITPHTAAVDKELNVKIKYPILRRKVEMRQYYSENGKAMIDWVDHAVKNFEDKNGVRWENPPFPKEYKNKTFYANFSLDNGNLPISSRFLRDEFDEDEYDDCFFKVAKLPPECAPKGFVYKNGEYVKELKENQGLGSVRISYYTLITEAEKIPTVTIVGSQKKGVVGMAGIDTRFYHEKVSYDEVKATYTQDNFTIAAGTLSFGVLFILLGLFKARG